MYEYRSPSFQVLPPVIKNLIILNGLMFLITYLYPDDMIQMFGLYYVKSDYFHPYQFVTHMFMHGGLFHVFINMFMLWMFGSQLERIWGPKRFLFFYFFCGLGAATIQSLVTYAEINYIADTQRALSMINGPTVGASGAVMGILLAFGMTFPNSLIFLLFPPIPIRAKYLVVILMVIDLAGGISSLQGYNGGVNIAHFAHLGGMLFGYILIKHWNRSRRNFY